MGPSPVTDAVGSPSAGSSARQPCRSGPSHGASSARARDSPVSSVALRTRVRRRPRGCRRAAVRRHPAGRARGAAQAQPAQHRPPRPAGDEPGDEPGDRYRRAARTLAAWRSDGTFRKDPRPAIYVYEQSYRVPGTDVERTQRGFFARLRLEPFGPKNGSCRTSGRCRRPREDRYLLLRATGVNTSPIIGLYEDPDGRARALLAGLTAATAPATEVTDGDGTRHRLWVVPVADGDAAGVDGALGQLLELARSQPLLIADGHHRYETALRYRDERRMTRSCEEDPAFDYIVALLLDTGEPLTVLPTHRVVRGLADEGRGLLERAPELFDVKSVDRAALEAEFTAAVLSPGGRGRFGLWTRQGGAVLTARRAAFEPLLPTGSDALRRQDVTLLQVALDRLCGIDADAVAAGRLTYTRSAREALDAVDDRTGRRRRRIPARADPGRVDRGRGRARRRDAPEVDLLLSEGPQRASRQSARMVIRE